MKIVRWHLTTRHTASRSVVSRAVPGVGGSVLVCCD